MSENFKKWFATQRHLASAKGVTDIIESPDDLADGSEWLFPYLKGKDMMTDEAQAILKRAERDHRRRVQGSRQH